MNELNRIEQLRKLIIEARNAYYGRGNSPLTDEEYDSLEMELKTLSPGDKIFNEIGPVQDDSVFPDEPHSIPMSGLDKSADRIEKRKGQHIFITAEEEFRKWWRLHNTSDDAVVASFKLDGASLALYYDGGNLVKALTRGDGKIGRNITSNAIKFIGVPKTIPVKGKISVRGEVVLSVANWKKINETLPEDEKSPNPRNLGTGTLSREDGTNCQYLRFVAFELVGLDFSTEEQRLKAMIDLGFQVTYFRKCNALDEALSFYREIQNARKDSAIQLEDEAIWIDGVVMKINTIAIQNKLGYSDDGCPKFSTAVKFTSPCGESVIESVENSVGMDRITPVANIKSVVIAGTTVKRATLNNWEFIAAKDAAIGDKILVVKGGDIIPTLRLVLERPAGRKEIVKPKKCPICGGNTGHNLTSKGNAEVFLTCLNADCPNKLIGRVKRLVGKNKLDILDVGETIITAMCQTGIIKTLGDLFRIEENADAIAALNVGNGVWGEKRTAKMISEVNAKREMTLDMFMGILGVKGLGQRRAKIIMDKVPKMGTLEAWRNGTLLKLATEAGVPGIAKDICEEIEKMSKTIDDLKEVVKIAAPKKKVSGSLSGKSFCFTGALSKTRDEFVADVEAAGGQWDKDLRSTTNYLVQADPSSQSSKTKKAEKYGTKVIGEAELIEMIEENETRQ